MALTEVHHVVIRVEDFDSSVKNWESILGYSVSRIDQNQGLGIQQAFFDLPGGGFIEIVSPTMLVAYRGGTLYDSPHNCCGFTDC